jgi:GPH family glycoside/pentoside/hexuronide:cation symporter
MNRTPLPSLLAYGTLRLPLALLELPLFVLLPSLYGRSFGLDLATLGGVLFATRLIDAVADPLIGTAIDRWRARFDLRAWVLAGLPVLTLGFAAMLLPPVRGQALVAWLAATSTLTYLAFSTVSIAYQSWGAGMGGTEAERVRVTTVREAFGLLGVLAAAALLTPERAAMLALAFAVFAGLAAFALKAAPAPLCVPGNDPSARPADSGWPALAGWRRLRSNDAFRWLMAVFMLNGVATAIPATLVLLFVDEVLDADGDQAAIFLVVYFLAGAVGMPVWLAVARRWGLRNGWLLGMALAVIGFVWTLGLGHGDFRAFGWVCVATGLALGSDLAMPPALLAAAIAEHGDQGRDEGAYFGLWSLATKFNPAVAGGVALPMLQWLRKLDVDDGGRLALSLAYAALPSLLKLLAGGVLLLAPLPDRDRVPGLLSRSDTP